MFWWMKVGLWVRNWRKKPWVPLKFLCLLPSFVGGSLLCWRFFGPAMFLSFRDDCV